MRRVLRLVAFLPLIAAASYVPVQWPSPHPPAKADAVIVLSGDHGERRPIAMSLVDRRLVSTLVFVGTPDRVDEEQLCQSRQRVEFICLRPQPDNTRAEAQAAARLAKARGWSSVIVVTSRAHVARSFILFRRCFGGSIRIMGGDPPAGQGVLPHQVPREWLKVAYTVAVERSC